VAGIKKNVKNVFYIYAGLYAHVEYTA